MAWKLWKYTDTYEMKKTTLQAVPKNYANSREPRITITLLNNIAQFVKESKSRTAFQCLLAEVLVTRWCNSLFTYVHRSVAICAKRIADCADASIAFHCSRQATQKAVEKHAASPH